MRVLLTLGDAFPVVGWGAKATTLSSDHAKP